MKSFFKKRICIQVNVWVLVITFLLLILIPTALILRLPEKLFFRVLDPEWVVCATANPGDTSPRQLTDEEISQIVHILRDFNFEGEQERQFGPDSKETAQFCIQLKWGDPIYIHCQPHLFYGINHNSYRTSPALRQLGELWMDNYRPVYPSGGAAQ